MFVDTTMLKKQRRGLLYDDDAIREYIQKLYHKWQREN